MLPFTDRTACRTSFTRLAVPARSLRITNVANGVPTTGAANMLSTSAGQYTKLGAFSYNPSSWTLCTTPITSRHASVAANVSNTFAERASGLGCELASEILGDQGHAAARFDIAPGDVASRNDPRAHGVEVPGRDELVSAPRRYSPCRQRLAFDRHGGRVTGADSIGRWLAKPADSDARKRRDLVEDLVLHAGELLPGRQTAVRNPDPRRLNGRRVRKPGVDVAQRLETFGS